jgi:ribosomal protein S5
VLSAIRKATHEAYKSVVDVAITDTGSVPYPRVVKYKSAIVKLLPAAPGT